MVTRYPSRTSCITNHISMGFCVTDNSDRPFYDLLRMSFTAYPLSAEPELQKKRRIVQGVDQIVLTSFPISDLIYLVVCYKAALDTENGRKKSTNVRHINLRHIDRTTLCSEHGVTGLIAHGKTNA